MKHPLKVALALTRSLRSQWRFYRLVQADPRTPRSARWLLGAAIAYTLSPIDLIPDWIPVLGYLDDVLIVPALILLARRMVPPQVIADCRDKCRRRESKRSRQPATRKTPKQPAGSPRPRR